jgi:serine-type D-Ala-D-Ala endopeptidase (penicillin-binding protein 7)
MSLPLRLLLTLCLLVFGMALQAQASAATESTTDRTTARKGKQSTLVKTGKKQRKVYAAKSGSRAMKASIRRIPDRPSHGKLAGLHHTGSDLLALKSSVALVVDQDTKEVLFTKNSDAVLPIASLTKLMTGLLIVEARLDMEQSISITSEDVDTEKGSTSRLRVGTSLTRGELLHLALMSSENRAAHALGRTYPGGLQTFVTLMNDKARALGMNDTRYVEPTGLSSRNQSSARDLVILTDVASKVSTLRELSTSHGYTVQVGRKLMQYNNTNRLTKSPAWDIGVQKTGYISEAGQCLLMQAQIAGRKVIMVFLDSAGKLSRIGDAERVRRWVESRTPMTTGQLDYNLSPRIQKLEQTPA